MTDRETPAGAVEALAKLRYFANHADPGVGLYANIEGRIDHVMLTAIRDLLVDVERWQRIETAAREVAEKAERETDAGVAYPYFLVNPGLMAALRDALGEG